LLSDFWRGKKVFLTGHTGFKGLWLAKWLDMLGARVSCYAMAPGETSMYEKIGFSGSFQSVYGDVRDAEALENAFRESGAGIIFHLAAQAIVGTAFEHPAETFCTNVAGTVNILEALRKSPDFKALVAVTSDKVYENTETLRPYEETDRLGGDEPYAASKAAAELAVNAYRNAYFKSGPGIATARASNVYGGGDLHFDRLIPYLIKTKISGGRAELRNPGSVRPWQYVLDLLAGYVTLAENVSRDAGFSGCWNFGPPEEDLYRVGDIYNLIMDGDPLPHGDGENFHEAGLLRVNSGKSRTLLGWKPLFTLEQGLSATLYFYRRYFDGKNATKQMEENISSYMKLTEGNV
jgi:CDP-glucose 4,6-dehydratase